MVLKDQLDALNNEAFMSGWEMGRATKYWDPDKNTKLREKYTVNSSLYLKTAKQLEEAILKYVEGSLEQQDKDTLSILRGASIQLLMAKELGANFEAESPMEIGAIVRSVFDTIDDEHIKVCLSAILLLGTYCERGPIVKNIDNSLQKIIKSLQIVPPDLGTKH